VALPRPAGRAYRMFNVLSGPLFCAFCLLAVVPSSARGQEGPGNPPPGAPSGPPPGGRPKPYTLSGAHTIRGKNTITETGKSYTADKQDLSAVHVTDGGSLTLVSPTITTSGNVFAKQPLYDVLLIIQGTGIAGRGFSHVLGECLLGSGCDLHSVRQKPQAIATLCAFECVVGRAWKYAKETVTAYGCFLRSVPVPAI
jgi:hypothetical protein